jgi:hypothetical protein
MATNVDPLREEAGTMPELFLNCERIRLRAWHMPNTKMKIPKGGLISEKYSHFGQKSYEITIATVTENW